MRGDGKTTKQMLKAPQGALYVWPNHHLSYPRQLACELKRSDLKIISPGQLENELMGARRKDVVLDHAVELDGRATRMVIACEVAGCRVFAEMPK